SAMRLNQTAGASRSQASRLIAPSSRSQLTFSPTVTRSPEARRASMNSRLSCQIIGQLLRGLGVPRRDSGCMMRAGLLQTTQRACQYAAAACFTQWNSPADRSGAKRLQHRRPGRERLRDRSSGFELDTAGDARARLQVVARL